MREHDLKELLRKTIPHLEFSADMAADEDWNPDFKKNEKEIRELIEEINEVTKQWNSPCFDNIPKGKHDVHTEHCCVIHGCKYGDDNCTVANKTKKQSFECQFCWEDREYL